VTSYRTVSSSTESDLSFPAGFVWGAATAAYQIEGAVDQDGRAPSIWDTFSRTPGKVAGGDTGDVACDHYHRYRDDVALMADLGLAAYRFSISWPRVLPGGVGRVNERGLDFYDRLADELCGRGIEPIATLYHWDLPQALDDVGGWTVRDTAEHLATYASVVHDRLGDRVRTWTTLNEPWCSAFLGYADGAHAPGRRSAGDSFVAVHHLLLGHGLAAAALRAGGATQVSVTLNLSPVVPADPGDPADLAAARTIDGLQNRLFLDPLLRGGYPADMLDLVARFTDLSFLRDGDAAVIATPIDLLGINYYSPAFIAARPGAPGIPMYPGSDGIAFLPGKGPAGEALPVTATGWPIEPSGLTAILQRVSDDYPGVPLMITENGAAFDDRPDDSADRVSDPDRISYLERHLRAAHEAIRRGVDLRGYLVWSLLDNFEWAEGYGKRFGIIYVDYDTQRRVPKDSARWYREVVRRNGLTR
jgi:beta-glucosidase